MKLLKMGEIGGRKLFAFLRGGDAMSRTSMKAVCLGAFALACSSEVVAKPLFRTIREPSHAA